jgi:peroxiredoxin family protein
MSSESTRRGSPFSLVLHDGQYDRVHYGLVMASAAAAIGRTVTILFAGSAVEVLQQSYVLPEQDNQFQARGVAGLEELLGACHELGSRVIVCETALAIADIKAVDLRTDLALETGGFVTYLNAIGEGGHSLFV